MNLSQNGILWFCSQKKKHLSRTASLTPEDFLFPVSSSCFTRMSCSTWVWWGLLSNILSFLYVWVPLWYRVCTCRECLNFENSGSPKHTLLLGWFLRFDFFSASLRGGGPAARNSHNLALAPPKYSAPYRISTSWALEASLLKTPAFEPSSSSSLTTTVTQTLNTRG